MDGIHDLGGRQGFGPVIRDGTEPFAAEWEARMHGVMVALDSTGRLPAGFRYAIERMDPVHYLASPYYEHWLVAVERLLAEAGTVSTAEVDAAERSLAAGAEVTRRADPEFTREVLGALRTPAPRDRDDDDAPAPRFRAGDRIRVRRVSPAGHTRLPGYVRGAAGIVVRVNGADQLQDLRLAGVRRLEHTYTVTFPAAALWPPDADPAATVHVDLWESYLDPDGPP